MDPIWNGLTNPQNTSGRFSIRDEKNGSYFQINHPSDNSEWECHVGLGYNTLYNRTAELASKLTYFIPRNGDDVLLMLLEVKNLSKEKKELDIFGQVEWNLGDATKSFILRGDGRGGSQFNLYKKVYMQDNILLAKQPNWRNTGSCIPWPYTGFFSVNEPVTSYETIKENFLGVGLDYNHPEAVEKGHCTNTDFWSQAEYPWGVLHNRLELNPGQAKTLIYILGMTGDEKSISSTVARYRSEKQVNKAFQDLAKGYNSLIHNAVYIETPDKENDRIINIWTKYQWRQFWKKSLNNGSYGLGLWSYGIEGEELSLNPEQVLLPFDMSLIRNGILNLISSQIADTTQTDLYEGTHTVLYKDLGINGPDLHHRSRFKVTHHHQMWGFLFSIYYYLLETDDLALLDKKLPYINGDETTVWEHIQRALAETLKDIDSRGLPRIPANVGDWMDEFTKISLHDRAESVMMAGEIAFLLKGFSEIADQYKHPGDSHQWMSYYEKIKRAVNEIAWDGKWYIRAFSDRNDSFIPVGSHLNEEGKIYINSQSWSILSGISTKERTDQSLQSAKKYLMSDYGPMCFYPSYTKYEDYIGTQSLYAPGFRNACIYLRPAGWLIEAACLNKDARMANELYDRASLKSRAKDIEQFLCEPYVYPENYDGPDHRLRGKGEFQWNLGEGAAWMWASYVNYILGVRPQLDGLLIDPQIPASRNGYKVKKEFRGSIFDIRVLNPGHVSNGVRSITINGKKINGNLVRMPARPGTYTVIVTM